MTLYLVALLTLPYLAVEAQVIGFGGCPSVQVEQNFTLSDYLGKWYEITKFQASFEKGLKCVVAEYSLKDNGHVKVNNSGYHSDGSFQTAIGDAIVRDPSKNEGKLGVKFSSKQPVYGNYWILGTDYNNYTLIWSCTDFKIFNIQFLWILVRDRSYATDANLKPIIDLAKGYGIKVEKLEKTDITDCRN